MGGVAGARESSSAKVYVGVGSNISPEENLRLAVRELRSRFRNLELSAIYRSAPFGFDGDDFLNLVAGFESDKSPREVLAEIEAIHNIAGREGKTQKWVSRPLDIDLLLYNDLILDEGPIHIPRQDVLKYSFVLRPLAELAPSLVHPETGKTIAEHWNEFDATSHPLELVGVMV